MKFAVRLQVSAATFREEPDLYGGSICGINMPYAPLPVEGGEKIRQR